MKSVGEVMSLGRTFEEAIQAAIRMIDFHNLGFSATTALMSIDQELQTPSDQRLFAIANAMEEGYSIETIWERTQIDRWFLTRLKRLSDFGKSIRHFRDTDVPAATLRRAKELGFSDRQLAQCWRSTELAVRRHRIEAGITPWCKQIDTVAAEFPATTNYLYLTYNGVEHDVAFHDHGVIVLGSGVYRIGSSVEYDNCSVRAIRTLRAAGKKTVMLNFNPETVSTDYSEVDRYVDRALRSRLTVARLYFENIDLETVLDIYQLEAPEGMILAMSGQSGNNLALALDRLNVRILGTSPVMIGQSCL